jgi:hypothetical protein
VKARFVLLLALAGLIILSGCKPMENKDLENKNRDNTSGAMKKAGADDSGAP